MHPSEEATIRAFIDSSRRPRWLELLGSPKRRPEILDRLNHCGDFDLRYALQLEKGDDPMVILTKHRAPVKCYVTSGSEKLDGRELPLNEAIYATELEGEGTLICCIPGRLAYYYGESGEQRLLLERKQA
jgi:hypothetical protein